MTSDAQEYFDLVVAAYRRGKAEIGGGLDIEPDMRIGVTAQSLQARFTPNVIAMLAAVAIDRLSSTQQDTVVMTEMFGPPDAEFLRYEYDPFILGGHPYTCNGGNPDFTTHHDHEVRLVRLGEVLACPECGRTQELRRLPPGWELP